VFDLDSPMPDRFSDADATLLQQVVDALDLADETV